MPPKRPRPVARAPKPARAEQLRAAKRRQRERQRAAGIRQVELALPGEDAERWRAAAASRHFGAALDGLLSEMAIDRTAWPVLREITWSRSDRWIPAEEALGLYERNWRHVDPARLGQDEAGLLQRLVDRFGGGVFNG